ncbi:hypothetical protein CF335_g8335 [Tilletia laevis]|nr:hypothetical protein CF335_g8335 [Tilletia laevis]
MANTQPQKPLCAVGDTFASFEDAEHAVTEYGVANGFSPGVKKSDKTRIVYRCGAKTGSCLWGARVWMGSGSRVKISRLDDMGTHTCIGTLAPYRPAWSKNAFLVRVVQERMTVKSSTPAKEIADVLRKGLNIEVSLDALYKAKKTLLGCHDEELRNQVLYLPAYFAKLKDADPDTIAVMLPDPSQDSQQDTKTEFKRCFIAPGPARIAFDYCRPIVALDGTFLKGKVKMVLLLAATFDANDSLIILAWALVSSESTSSWSWFIKNLKAAFPRIEKPFTTITSDRDKGLLAAVEDELPEVCHAYCCYHLAANLKKHHGASTQPLFWRCVYATSKQEFDRAMGQLRERCKEAADYLCAPEQAHEHWASYAFPNRRWGLVTSNLAEIANALLVPIRSLPLLQLLSSIYEHQQEKYYARRVESQAWQGPLSPTATRNLKVACDAARGMSTVPSCEFSGLVRSGTSAWEVYLPKSNEFPQGACTCGIPQQLLRPCAHLVALSVKLRQQPISHVHSSYSKSTWTTAYNNSFFPVSTSDLPVADWLEGPELTQTKGRRRIKRMEKGKKQKEQRTQPLCSICQEGGHTRKSCSYVHFFSTA